MDDTTILNICAELSVRPVRALKAVLLEDSLKTYCWNMQKKFRHNTLVDNGLKLNKTENEAEI